MIHRHDRLRTILSPVLGTITATELIARYGSPLYVYNLDLIRHRYKELRSDLDAAGLSDLRIHYAVKANHNLDVITTLADAGAGADIVSWGEWHRARAAGINSLSIIFSGVGKRCDELLQAMQQGIGQINVESISECGDIIDIADRYECEIPPLLLRFTPEASGAPHPYIATAHALSKFGLAENEIHKLMRDHPDWRSAIHGLAIHIGSQITDTNAFRHAFSCLKDLLRDLEAKYGWTPRRIDLGGGLGIAYNESESRLDLKEYAAAISEMFSGTSVSLAIEPGRFLVGEAGLLLTRVIRCKTNGAHSYAIVDAAMNDLLRPALYQASHPIVADRPRTGHCAAITIVGPVCESADVFCRDELMPRLEAGDVMWIGHAGAYAAVMASTYNARDILAEVVIEGDQARMSRPGIPESEFLEREINCARRPVKFDND